MRARRYRAPILIVRRTAPQRGTAGSPCAVDAGVGAGPGVQGLGGDLRPARRAHPVAPGVAADAGLIELVEAPPRVRDTRRHLLAPGGEGVALGVVLRVGGPPLGTDRR